MEVYFDNTALQNISTDNHSWGIQRETNVTLCGHLCTKSGNSGNQANDQNRPGVVCSSVNPKSGQGSAPRVGGGGGGQSNTRGGQSNSGGQGDTRGGQFNLGGQSNTPGGQANTPGGQASTRGRESKIPGFIAPGVVAEPGPVIPQSFQPGVEERSPQNAKKRALEETTDTDQDESEDEGDLESEDIDGEEEGEDTGPYEGEREAAKVESGSSSQAFNGYFGLAALLAGGVLMF